MGDIGLSNSIDSPAFTGGVLSEFKLRLSRVFLPLPRDIPPNDLLGDPQEALSRKHFNQALCEREYYKRPRKGTFGAS